MIYHNAFWSGATSSHLPIYTQYLFAELVTELKYPDIGPTEGALWDIYKKGQTSYYKIKSVIATGYN